MNQMYEWLQEIAVFFILMTAVLNILPEAKYRRYVQFFLGLVMLAVLSRPILALGNLNEILEVTLEKLTLEEEVRGMEDSRIRVEGIQKEVLFEAYEEEISRQIVQFLEGMGVVPVEAEVVVGQEEGEAAVERIAVTIRKENGEENAAQERELKKELAEVYQVSEAHIIVKLQE